MQRTFDPVRTDREKAIDLTRLKQGIDSVSDYAIRFRTLAPESSWNAAALYDTFLQGLAAPIRAQLVPLDMPSDLDAMIALAIRTDHRLRELQKSRSGGSAETGRDLRASAPGGFVRRSPPPDQRQRVLTEAEEPMQLGRARLTQAERRR